MPTDQQLDAMRLLLLDEPPDFAKARAHVPPSDGSVTELAQLVVVKNETMVVTGDLKVNGPVVLELGACLWVLGDCAVSGVVYSEGLQYSVLAVGGCLTAHLVRTAGEVFALGGLRADTLIGVYNDHSTYSPKVTCKTYIAYDRSDFIGELFAETKLTEPDSIEYGFDLLFPELYPRREDEDDASFERREHAFFTRGLAPPVPAPMSADEVAVLREQLRSSKHEEWRAAHHVIRRKHALVLAPDLAEVIRRAPEKSAEAIDVLGSLKAADVLTSLIDGSVHFGRAASALARAFSNAGWETQSTNTGEWVFSVRPSAEVPWRRIP